MHPLEAIKASARQIIAGCILMAIGCASPLIVPWLIKFTLETVRSLKPDGILSRTWQKYPFPLYYEIFMFNWTNPEDIYNTSTKPHFQEVGPFVFVEDKTKVNLTWNANDTVTYRLMRYWYFDETRSAANLSTKIITINALALSAAHRIRFWNYILQKTFDFSLRMFSHKVYVEKTVGELIFEGYSDPIINIAGGMPFPDSMHVPKIEKFGFFVQRNASYTFDGTFNIGTVGANFGKLLRWNYEHESSYFAGACNRINGSAGDFFPTFMKQDAVEIYWTDTCRPIMMEYVNDEVVDGTKGYKYAVGDRLLDNGTKHPENLCYETGDRIPSGMLNITSCRYGAPGFISLPHFYQADPYYAEKVEGLHPDKERHQTFAVFEPTTGLPLHVEARFQLNVLLHPMKPISIFKNVPTLYFPIMWVEQKATIPGFYHILLKIFLYTPLVLYGLAAIITFTGILILTCGFWKIRLRDVCRRHILLKRKMSLHTETVSNDSVEDERLLA